MARMPAAAQRPDIGNAGARPAPSDAAEADRGPGVTDGWRALATALVEREVAAAGPGPDGDRATIAAADIAVRRAQSALHAALEADGALRAMCLTADLEPVDIQVLVLCAGVELDRRLQRMVGLLQHDPASDRLQIDLLVRILGSEALEALADDGRLSRAALLDVEEQSTLAAAHVAVPRRVAWALLGDLSLDPGLPPGAEVVVPDEPSITVNDMVLVSGPDRVRRIQAAIGELAGGAFLLTPAPAGDTEWRAVVRQATVGGLSVVLEYEGPPSARDHQWMDRAGHLSFAVCTADPIPLESTPRRRFIDVRADDPAVRDAEWYAAFPDTEPPGRRPTASELFLARKVWRPGEDPQQAFRRVAGGALLRHAHRVTPSVGWKDLVLPRAQERALRGLVGRYRDRRTVHDEWNLPLYPSPGVVALFAGPSGTGKSTAAEVIAGDLGVDMFRVDLSSLVSKYIGETEKNLEEIFSAAHSGDYLLLFDEADALFGARSKVTDARDRYANMEISYLLQRLETYAGFVILTSNFQGNIDEAFLRRIHVAVHFAVPTAGDRRSIWERSLAGAPQRDVDLEFVAEKFDLTGGSIRMAALSAAYLAAGRGTPIGMVELLIAVNQEMTKLRRRASDEQFGRWLPEVTGISV